MKEERPPDAGAASSVEATAAVGQSEAMSPTTRRKATKAVLLYRRGLTMEQVAVRLGVSVARVCQYLKAMEEPARHRGPQAKPKPDPRPVGRPRIHPKLERVCRCGCGLTFEPSGRAVTDGFGWYVDAEHHRRHVEFARAEFAEQTVWMSIAGAAKELKVDRQTVRQWGGIAGRGQVRLQLRRFEDVPELAHLRVIGLRYVVAAAVVRALRKQLLEEWRFGGGTPPERLRDQYGATARNRWTGRQPRETDGGEHGLKGGRSRDWGEHTAEIQQRILDLDRQGLSTREIAADPAVFGDGDLHLRVWRFLNA